MTTSRLRSFAFALCLLTTVARADDNPSQKEANLHFQRAILLYGEADYRAALVEFKRAYEIAPHVTLLYNLGQTYHQLQNYADALTTFERFLAEGGSAHRAEVENAVGVLKSRVGKLDIAAAAGSEITIDDEPVGKAPLGKPVSVSIGRRRVAASRPGETPTSRFVDVAAGETQAISLDAVPPRASGASPKSQVADVPAAPRPEPAHSSSRTPWIIGGWALTGAVAAGAVVTGIVALDRSHAVSTARDRTPATRTDLEDKARESRTLGVVTDVLIGSSIVLGGISLYLTLSKPPPSAAQTAPRVRFAGNELLLEGAF